jgi:hypothetical protein
MLLKWWRRVRVKAVSVVGDCESSGTRLSVIVRLPKRLGTTRREQRYECCPKDGCVFVVLLSVVGGRPLIWMKGIWPGMRGDLFWHCTCNSESPASFSSDLQHTHN